MITSVLMMYLLLIFPHVQSQSVFIRQERHRLQATISWSSSSAAFNIEVGPMGFTQGTGTSYSSHDNFLHSDWIDAEYVL